MALFASFKHTDTKHTQLYKENINSTDMWDVRTTYRKTSGWVTRREPDYCMGTQRLVAHRG